VIGRIRALLKKAYGISANIVLLVNLTLAASVAVVHGGALLLARAKPSAESGFVESVARVTLPIAGFLIVTALLALAVPRSRMLVLRLHGILLFAGAWVGLLWGIELLLNGVHFTNFVWTPGMFTASVCYAAFVLAAFSLSRRWRARPLCFYLPAWMLVAAAVVDLGVFLRFVYELGSRFGAV
jgi:hypothetical protein